MRLLGMIATCGMLLFAELVLYGGVNNALPVQCAFGDLGRIGAGDPLNILSAVAIIMFLIVTYGNRLTALYSQDPNQSMFRWVGGWFAQKVGRQSTISREARTVSTLRRISAQQFPSWTKRLLSSATICNFVYEEFLDSFLWQIIWLIFSNMYGLLQLLAARFLGAPKTNGNENEMGFGQLVALLLLALPALAVAEVYYGIVFFD